MPASGIKPVMKIVGILIYYTLALDNTLLVALSDISSVQAQCRVSTWYAIMWLLNYCTTYHIVEIKYIASNMCVHAHLDVSYRSVRTTRSQSGARIFLSDHPKPPPPHPEYKSNGPIHIIYQITNLVIGSSASKKWDIVNPPPLYKLTTPPQSVLRTKPSSNANLKPSIWAFTGYRIGVIRASSLFTRPLVKITQVTIASITLAFLIIILCGPLLCILPILWTT